MGRSLRFLRQHAVKKRRMKLFAGQRLARWPPAESPTRPMQRAAVCGIITWGRIS
jgi:hypothetical protein